MTDLRFRVISFLSFSNEPCRRGRELGNSQVPGAVRLVKLTANKQPAICRFCFVGVSFGLTPEWTGISHIENLNRNELDEAVEKRKVLCRFYLL